MNTGRPRITTRKFNITFRKRIAETGDRQFIHLQIGRAYENEDGNIDVIINSIPLNWDGKIRLWHVRDDSDNLDIIKEDIDQHEHT